MQSPTPEQVLAARTRLELSQTAAAKLVFSYKQRWSSWENGTDGMHPGLFLLFQILTHPELKDHPAIKELLTMS